MNDSASRAGPELGTGRSLNLVWLGESLVINGLRYHTTELFGRI